jgi:hypothetical protein
MTVPGTPGGTSVALGGSPATVRVITAGGMAGWQITPIALGAALFAAAAALLLDRALTASRAASARDLNLVMGPAAPATAPPAGVSLAQ